ncbi:MAG: alanine racemase [Terracidiphilus sp.]|nr:alanine racemase [Terracidiphilus sp.]
MTKRPCWVEISTRAFEENFRFLAKLAAPHAELMAIVKADSYGHSLALCAPAAVRAGAKWLGVTSVEEAVETRALCPEPRIFAIGGAFAGQGAAVVENRITAAAWEFAQLDELEAAAAAAGAQRGSIPVHVEIDTGMSRQGVVPEQLKALLARFTPSSPLRLDGVMTHLFAADEADGKVTELQIERLSEALAHVTAPGLLPDWLSVGSSPALVRGYAAQLAEVAGRHGMRLLMRPGLALYGVVPRFDPAFEGEEPATLKAARAELKPVLAWKSRVIGVRSIPAGAVVGYNGTFVATEPMRIALVAAGYADGVDRHLGNRFHFLVRGQKAPLTGRVCMDHTMLDVTEIPGVETGDEVVLLGTQGAETITAQEHADTTGTIPWEVFTRITARVDRVAV